MGKNNPPTFAAVKGLRWAMVVMLAVGWTGLAGDRVSAQDIEQQELAKQPGESDDNALDALTSAISTYKKNLQAIKDALREAPEPSKLTGELTTAKDIIDDLTIRLNQIRDERNAVAAELVEYREKTDAQIASLRLDSDRDRGLMAQIQTELGETKSSLADAIQTRTALESLLTEQQVTADELEQQLRGDLETRQQQITGLQTVRDGLQADLAQLRDTSTTEIDTLSTGLTDANQQNEALRVQLAEAQQQVVTLEAEGGTLKGELASAKQVAVDQAAALTTKFESATSRANSLSGRLTVSEQQVVELQEAQQLLESELVKLTENSQTETAGLKTQLGLARQEIVDREASYDELSKQMAEATAAAANETAEMAGKLELTEQQLATLEEERTALQVEYTGFRQTMTGEKKTLETQLDQTSASVVELEANRAGLMGQISEATVTAQRCVADVGELGEQLIAALHHLEQLEAALAQAQAGRSALAAELAAARRENGPAEEAASTTQ